MSRLYLVRHGEAAAGFAEAADPGLSDLGRAQAEAMAADLEPLGRLAIVVSPLRRCLETAAPLAARWSTMARVDPAVGEVRAPNEELMARSEWLRGAIAGTWDDLGDAYLGWRQSVVDALLALDADTVVVSHYIAINAALGEATARREVVCARVANCSVTVLDNSVGLRLVVAGAQGVTVIN